MERRSMDPQDYRLVAKAAVSDFIEIEPLADAPVVSFDEDSCWPHIEYDGWLIKFSFDEDTCEGVIMEVDTISAEQDGGISSATFDEVQATHPAVVYLGLLASLTRWKKTYGIK